MRLSIYEEGEKTRGEILGPICELAWIRGRALGCKLMGSRVRRSGNAERTRDEAR